MLVNRHVIVKREILGLGFDHSHNIVIRYAVTYDHGLRRTYEAIIKPAGTRLVEEDWVEEEEAAHGA